MNIIHINSQLDLYPMKKIEIIILGEYESLVANYLVEAGISGYTLMRNISGFGHSGFHEGNLLFNDKTVQVMFIAVSSEESIGRIAKKMKDIFREQSGVMFISDVSVSRLDYFKSEK
jgi:PII-like signaling protein